MDHISREHDKLEVTANLAPVINDVQEIIEKLQAYRKTLHADGKTSTNALAMLQQHVGAGFDAVKKHLSAVDKAQKSYGKAVQQEFKDQTLPFAGTDQLSKHAWLVRRAIAMHLLREGNFTTATRFITEANQLTSTHLDSLASQDHTTHFQAWEDDFAPSAYRSTALQKQFSEMYNILHELKVNRNLTPAIDWAHRNSKVLDARASNLEFDLCRLQYISLFTSTRSGQGPLAAITYARTSLHSFPPRYAADTRQLLGALAYAPNLKTSPYTPLFAAAGVIDSNITVPDTYAAASQAFTSEFCALLSLSSASPLLTAVTAGCIALPTLLKLSQIQASHRTSWTTAAELPVEISLPAAFHFHSIFVCPVSKEQGTDHNPPFMLPCGHVIAKESLENLSRNARFKCPYCPTESYPKDARRVFL